MEEQIDILMATYNGEKYLKEQIESILNQTYKSIRLVISDDCSKDRTKEILKQYEHDNRIEVHYHDKNQGYIKNFEYLIKQVKNNIYMLSDQDDVWLPEKVKKSYETLIENNADLVFGDLEVVDENLKTMYKSFNKYMLLDRKIKKYINSYKVNYLYNCVTGCTLISKSKWIKEIVPIPTDSKYIIHDYWMGLIIALKGKLAYMPEAYIKYRQHGNNQVGTDKISHGFKKIEQVRELFINVKLGVFGTYVENNDRFPESMQKLNVEIYDYFKMIQNKKNINFRKWGTFHKLYKTESFSYYMLNFIIMNLPILGRPLFNIRYGILKILGKR